MSFLTGKPDRIIGVNYLERCYILPRNPLLNIYVHKFIGSDSGRDTHDHPWISVSILLTGCLYELTQKVGHGSQGTQTRCLIARRVRRFIPVFRRATHAHRLTLASSKPAWTIFITGPAIRRWGFWTDKGWVYWREYLGVPKR